MPQAQLTNIEALKKWWKSLSDNYCYWTLYMGHARNKSSASNIGANVSETDRDEALRMLVSSIEDQSGEGGRFTILAKEKTQGNYGVTTFLTLDKNSVAGIGGMQMMNPGLGVIGNPSLQNYIAGEKDKAVESALMRKEIEELKEQQQAANAPTSFFGEVRAMMTEDPEGLTSILAGIFTGVSGLVAAIPKREAPVQDQQAPPREESNLTPEAGAALNNIHQKYDLNTVIPNLEKFMEDNPEIADQLTNS